MITDPDAARNIALALPLLVWAIAVPDPTDALTLEDAIIHVVETNPEITTAEASKQAIEFELDQARSLFAPRIDLEGRLGAAVNDGDTVNDLSAEDDALAGYELRAVARQTIFDGFQTRSEIERQAYRVDAAALRVLERSEFLALEAVKSYSNVLSSRELARLAADNLDYHRDVVARIERGFDENVIGIADQQQARERVLLAEDILTSLQLGRDEAEAEFLRIVGVAPSNLGSVPNIGGRLPADLATALSSARRFNPTIRFLQSDVGASEALLRTIESNRYPTIDLEADARYGEDVDSFEGTVSEARIGVVLRYTFQGGFERAERQEHVRRIAETRGQLLTRTREVEEQVRRTWAGLTSVRRRVDVLERQVSLVRELRSSYEAEFEIGLRTLLDVLNTQNALIQSQVDLVNARALARFTEYRLMATMGRLLSTVGVAPPQDAQTYAVQSLGAPPVSTAETAERFDARSYREWRERQ